MEQKGKRVPRWCCPRRAFVVVSSFLMRSRNKQCGWSPRQLFEYFRTPRPSLLLPPTVSVRIDQRQWSKRLDWSVKTSTGRQPHGNRFFAVRPSPLAQRRDRDFSRRRTTKQENGKNKTDIPGREASGWG